MTSYKVYDVAIVGAGACGLTCAYFLSSSNVVVFDKLDGARKLSITGNNRCNLSNMYELDEFLGGYGKNGKFLRDAFSLFFRDELLNWIKDLGAETTVEDGKIYLKNITSKAFARKLKRAVKEKIVSYRPFEPVVGVSKSGKLFKIETTKGIYVSNSVVLATGGMSFPSTGSDGSGYLIAEELGHTVVPLEPIETPFCVKNCCEGLMGVSLGNVIGTLIVGDKKFTEKGEILFTHFGVSGPLVFKLSALSFDRAKLLFRFVENEFELMDKIHHYRGKTKNFLNQYLPKKLASLAPCAEKFSSHLTKAEIEMIKDFLTKFELDVKKCGFDKAFVTKGGITTKEVDPKTFQSRLIENLYFCGEILDIQGSIGGYNLQYAFSSGFTVAQAINKVT